MKYIKTLILTIVFSLPLMLTAAPVVSAAPPAAIVADLKGDAQNGLDQAGGGGVAIHDAVHAVTNILSLVVGILSVIMIIVSGIKFVTSGGDSAKVGSAKNTLAYAIAGLVIVALAQTIVHFVLNATTQNSVNAG